MNLGQHQEIFAGHVANLIHYALEKGYGVRLGEAQRTVEQQQLYVKTGRSKTMNSMHIKKCAIDLHFTRNGELCYPAELGKYWESLDPLNQAGMFWKTFKDSPHMERRVP